MARKSGLSCLGVAIAEPGASNVPSGSSSAGHQGRAHAALNDARFKLDARRQVYRRSAARGGAFQDVELWKGCWCVEGLANRDSLPYGRNRLGEVDGLKDLFRGTLRCVRALGHVVAPANEMVQYKGFSRVLDTFRSLGLNETKPLNEQPSSWN